MKRIHILLTSLCLVLGMLAQAQAVKRMEPAFWWVGMQNRNLQILLYDNAIANATITIDNPKIQVKSYERTANPNYVFINVEIASDATPGTFPIQITRGKKQTTINYELKARRSAANAKPAFTGNDAIYLITPDRFANANPGDDNVPGFLEPADRNNIHGRHGGDIQGIANHIDYIKNLGMTTVWMNPMIENNQPEYSYHGYAPTDFYAIDARYGSNEEFKQLVEKLHQNDMKLVKDQIFNHCGSYHWWMQDLPAKDWINSAEKYGRSNFENMIVSDPHQSQLDKDQHYRGYFDTNMPDLNYENHLLATYMIQNSIWWIEYANIDGLRIDTYPYSDKNFLIDWRTQLEAEYPGIFVVAEVWVNDVPYAAFWNSPGFGYNNYQSGIKSITDFPLYYNMLDAFKPDGDVYKVYKALTMDFLYGHAENNVIFFDNHDVSRSFAVLDYNLKKYKLATVFTFTTRGILQWYYGSEFLMQESANHGVIRQDMPGGWEQDSCNVFTLENLTTDQKEILALNTQLLNWRKTSEAVKSGKLIQFKPNSNIYVYFRIADNERIMVILNNSDYDKTLPLNTYNEVIQGFTKATNIITQEAVPLKDSITVKANTPYVFILN
ncbi:alpha-amylase family glycosyl hydrolase [Plebeiibacterium marinum]|uniref:Alpha-amylase family glycosyl hydrolase n=1 Tax=Plebeiibacterium marinum TaxID=2992111 RepID=A0AAE3MI26_9BACT|nr:alpha-amylase family glycosyl hydrolase [Plebeiobacterium marinum]MCW3808047.1 alpha-amylase family glycosyl hydrolase [Plebeiobacterium marinum]